MSETNSQYDKVINGCRDIFLKKTGDYGTAWRVLRPISIVDQVFIKAQRIRTIQEKKQQRILENIGDEFAGIINYAVIGMMQLTLGSNDPEELGTERVASLYEGQVTITRELMENKNHDYGEAWRSMSQESFVDLILMKLQRIRQIIANDGQTQVSEGIDANYADILNYAVFALILMDEKQTAAAAG